MTVAELVERAKAGNLEAFGRLIEAHQRRAYGAALQVLRDPAAAQDAVQHACIRAFRRLGELDRPEAFSGWLRRVVVTVALNMRRARRDTFLTLQDLPDVPVLDEAESRWTDRQRLNLAAALLTLSPHERQLCDRRYHGGWSTARLAASAGVDEGTMRKRLQRIRDRLRSEVEKMEERTIGANDMNTDLPARILELLARPRLTDLPENPVGRTHDLLRGAYPEFTDVSLPEMIDLQAAASVARDAVYVNPSELHRVDNDRILRYDLTLPLLLQVRSTGAPLRLWATGKTYRVCQADATHLEAFHQAEAFWLDERERIDPWQLTARVLASVDRVLPGRTVKIVPTTYPMCRQAWELEVEHEGGWSEVLAWGEFSDRVVTHLGDPARHRAMGAGYGLERLAMLRFDIDDIRKVDVMNVA